MGLTGGIGAGKSTIARALAEHGARIVDGDRAARAVVDRRTTTGDALLGQIVRVIGIDALTDDGDLDRAAVAERVFADDELLQEYNALLRPAVLAEVAQRIADACSSPGIVVHEIPLLTRSSAPLPWRYDLVITVEAAENVRLQRLQHGRGHSIDEARRRIRAQGEEADRIAIADVVLRTYVDLTETLDEIDALWARLNSEHPPR